MTGEEMATVETRPYVLALLHAERLAEKRVEQFRIDGWEEQAEGAAKLLDDIRRFRLGLT